MHPLRPHDRRADILQAAFEPLALAFGVDLDDENASRELLRVLCDPYEEEKEADAIIDALELAGWGVSGKELKELEAFPFRIHEECERATRAWVASNGIVPRLAVGAQVEVRRGGRTHMGEVAAIYPNEARYLVRVESAGHVCQGVGTHGWLLPFEALHDIAAPPEEFRLTSPTG